jgi:hypothetical protein
MVSHVTQAAEGVHRLTHGVSNFYLIEEAGKLVLVDAARRETGPCSPRQSQVWGRPSVIWTRCC